MNQEKRTVTALAKTFIPWSIPDVPSGLQIQIKEVISSFLTLAVTDSARSDVHRTAPTQPPIEAKLQQITPQFANFADVLKSKHTKTNKRAEILNKTKP
ncbi:MAG: hypothetical protein Q8L51_01930 [Candidatus Amesbacteria bacterium]|nr:hypothetical protein [Candidatus Amesbacteria bacterium]